MKEYQLITINRSSQFENSIRDIREHEYTYNRSVISKRNRRNRLIKRNVRLVSLTAAILLIIVLSFSRLNAQATTVDYSQPIYKYYTSVQIVNGDSLWTIASKYTDGTTNQIFDCMDEIRSINHLGKHENIKSGEYLIVPYYSDQYLE